MGLKGVKIYIICAAMLLLLNGCSIEHEPAKAVGSSNSVAEFDNIDFSSVLSYTALIDDSVILQYSESNTIEYVRVSLSEEKALGQISDFYLKMRQSALDYPCLYFFVSLFNQNNPTSEAENVLMRINLEEGGIEKIENQDFSVPGISTYYFNNHIVTLKNIVSDETTNTFIESFDIENQKWKKLIECSLDNKKRQGTAVYGVCANKENIFVLYDICTDNRTIDTYLKVFDKNFQEVESVYIEQDIHDYILTSFISDMQAIDDYIYICNASNYGYLAKIEDGKIHTVFKGRNFELALDPSYANPIFYTRGENTLYLIDNSGRLSEHKIDIANDYAIQTVLSNANNLFIVCYADDKPNHAYLVDKNDIDIISLQCD